MSKDNDGDLAGKCKQTQFLTVITARKRSYGKVMFLHLFVILFGGCHDVTSCYGTPKYGTSRTAPLPHGQQVVRILLGCFLGSALFSHRKTANLKEKNLGIAFAECEWAISEIVSPPIVAGLNTYSTWDPYLFVLQTVSELVESEKGSLVQLIYQYWIEMSKVVCLWFLHTLRFVRHKNEDAGFSISSFLPTAREGNIFTGVCLSTGGLS